MTNDTEDRRSRKTWSGDHFDDSDECISQMTECLDTFKGLKIEKFDRKWKFPLESEAEVENEFSDIEYQGDDGEEMHSGLIYGCIVGYDGAEYYDSIPVEMLPDKDSIDDSEGDDDTRACLPCPFCYIGIEVHALCSHLQEEHCFDLKNAVCPLCAASLGKDVTGHFIAQHTTSIKRRKRHQKSGVLTGGSPMLVKELSSFLGSPTSKRGNADKNPLNSLIPPYLYSTTYSDTKGMQQDSSTGDSAFVPSVVKSYDPPEVDEDNIESKEERRRKVAFVQELIMSTIF